MKKIFLIMLIASSCYTKEVPVEKIYGIVTNVNVIKYGKYNRYSKTEFTVTFGSESKIFTKDGEMYDIKVGDEWLYYKRIK